MTKVHEDERLNGLIGKCVKITFWDGDIEGGILGRSEYSKRYSLKRANKGDLNFYSIPYGRVQYLKLHLLLV